MNHPREGKPSYENAEHHKQDTDHGEGRRRSHVGPGAVDLRLLSESCDHETCRPSVSSLAGPEPGLWTHDRGNPIAPADRGYPTTSTDLRGLLHRPQRPSLSSFWPSSSEHCRRRLRSRFTRLFSFLSSWLNDRVEYGIGCAVYRYSHTGRRCPSSNPSLAFLPAKSNATP